MNTRPSIFTTKTPMMCLMEEVQEDSRDFNKIYHFLQAEDIYSKISPVNLTFILSVVRENNKNGCLNYLLAYLLFCEPRDNTHPLSTLILENQFSEDIVNVLRDALEARKDIQGINRSIVEQLLNGEGQKILGGKNAPYTYTSISLMSPAASAPASASKEFEGQAIPYTALSRSAPFKKR